MVFDFCSMIVMIDMTGVTVTVIVIVMTEEDEMTDTLEGDCPLDLLSVIVCMCTCVLLVVCPLCMYSTLTVNVVYDLPGVAASVLCPR